MRLRLLNVLPAMLAFIGAVSLAHADIYRWTDASGRVNVSNLPPPEDVRVTSVTKETPQDVQARYEALHQQARQAEFQAMSERIQQLENQAAQPPVVVPQVQIVPVPVTIQAPVQYSYPVEVAQPAAGGCDPSWAGCGGFWNPGYYPSVIVVNNGPFRRRPGPPRFNPGYPVISPIQGFPALRPMQAAGPLRRG
jgi:hypothetical protein